MRPPRGLSAGEAALWAQVASTVKPLNPRRTGEAAAQSADGGGSPPSAPTSGRLKPILPATTPLIVSLSKGGGAPPRIGEGSNLQTLDRHGLDSSWERKLAKAAIAPDFTLDLHGHTLDAAHDRLDHGLSLALAQGARIVLVITGRARPVDASDRGSRRGAIRAKLLDWLAAGPHGSRIAAVRPAHPWHGGAGAVYVVLRKTR
jgi:DNA-nicking Smr family endonuclease